MGRGFKEVAHTRTNKELYDSNYDHIFNKYKCNCHIFENRECNVCLKPSDDIEERKVFSEETLPLPLNE